MNTEQTGELPSVSMPERAQNQHRTEAVAAAAPELRIAPGPSPAPQSTAVAPAMAPPLVTDPAADPTVPATTSVSTTTPAIADDVDLIEKEWVDKAKQIVAMTGSDPYEQKQEVDRLKADYMQKRYNKTVKVSEE